MKKVIAIITTALMIMTVIPSVAFAAENENGNDNENAQISAPYSEEATEPGDVNEFGDVEGVENVDNMDLDVSIGTESEETYDEALTTKGNEETGDIRMETDENGNTFFYINDELQKNCWVPYKNNEYYAGADGAILKGFQTINGELYYLNPYKRFGFWKNENNKYYYFGTNGAALKGLQTVNGYKYFFSPEMKTGIVRIGSVVYKFNSDGKAYTGKGWIDNKTRYANGDGTVANSVRYIDKKYYLFNANTGAKITKTGFATQTGKTYYIKSGVVSRGWKAIGNKAYYFYKSGKNVGAQAKNTKIGYLKIPASGYLGEAYARGIKKLDKTKWTLRQAYKNSYKIKYQGRWWRQKSAEKYALKGFKKNKGNCYVMASTFYIQAKLLGYNVRQIEGKVNGRHPHSWTQIKHGKKWYVYDPNFRNETGRNGWKIYYGKKGTWRYNRYHVFQN